jgi:YVTN family beta-propeller protein
MLKIKQCAPTIVGIVLACVLWVGGPCPAQQQPEEGSRVAGQPLGDSPRKLVKGGIAVELSIEPLDEQKKTKAELTEEDVVRLGFRITDSASGATLSGLRPSAWLDHREARKGLETAQTPASASCQEKIRWFLQGSLALQPSMDLNTYYILALNDKPNISVINPQLGFYISKLITSIPLKSRGEDWALTRDGKRLFVSLAQANQVAVINTQTWKVESHIDVGSNPVRMALQPDERYLWVGNDSVDGAKGSGGVTVVDSAKLQVIRHIPTGAGHHEMAFSDDGNVAFVTNQEDGTLTVISVAGLGPIKHLRTGSQPVSLAFGRHAKALYVAHEGDGKIVVVGGKDHEVLASMAGKPGLRAIRFSPDGRWGFALNYRENVVNIVDSALNRILHTVEVEPGPDQVAFSAAFAYIRSAGSNQVNMIQLSLLGKADNISVAKFSGGQYAPAQSSQPAAADVMVPTPEVDVMLVANPVDRTIYYHMEGMLAPMGSFQNYGSEPRAVLVVDRSLRETASGFYATVISLPPSGNYDLAFLLDAPRVDQCFEVEVKADPAGATAKQAGPPRLEVRSQQTAIKAGEAEKYQFLLTNAQTGQPMVGLEDLRVLFFTPVGNWQKRAQAKALGSGEYETEVALPRPGIYYVFFESPSLKVRYEQVPHLMLRALGNDSATGMDRSESKPAVAPSGSGNE